ncbi:hypothetical protein NP493_64g06010 [Ridgeia piscesae]|uniref:Uncharacterized protein n=1 Tax=Ridgeia piscesae TaxID=27915 RepID=A0AAD9PA82_RIDPI|nr:hypothetical protein NP493_64g06010 [Ridgeia piscesae]
MFYRELPSGQRICLRVAPVQDRDKGAGAGAASLRLLAVIYWDRQTPLPAWDTRTQTGHGTVSVSVRDRLSRVYETVHQSKRLSQSVYETVSVSLRDSLSLRDRFSQSKRLSQSVYEDRFSQSKRLSQSVYETVSVSLRDCLSQSTRPFQSV